MTNLGLRKKLIWLVPLFLLPGNIFLLYRTAEVERFYDRRTFVAEAGKDPEIARLTSGIKKGKRLRIFDPAFVICAGNGLAPGKFVCRFPGGGIGVAMKGKEDMSLLGIIDGEALGILCEDTLHLFAGKRKTEDLNGDFIPEFLTDEKGKTYLLLEGAWQPCRAFDRRRKCAILDDGRRLLWREGAFVPQGEPGR